MRQTIRSALAPTILLSLAIGAAAQAQHRAPLRGFDAYVAQAVKDWNVPGLAIGVVKDDSVVFAKGYGVRQLGRPEPVTIHTRFANASTTKAFTSMLVAMLSDDGKLNLDDRVLQHYPDYVLATPYVTQELRIRDLLSHRVGFGDPGYLWYGTQDDFAQIVRHLRWLEPETSFRSRYAYNNVTYATAGMIAGRVAGSSWDALIRARIYQPLDMTETVPQAKDLPAGGDVAELHDFVNDTLVPISRGPGDAVHLIVDNIAPAGAQYSTISDMVKWIRFLLDSGEVNGKRLVSRDAFAEMFRPQTVIPESDFYPTTRRTHPHFTAYGMGWFLEDYRGEFVPFHTGSIDGTVAIVGLLPSRHLGLVIFANRDHAELRHALMYRVFDSYLGGPARDWSTELRVMYDSIAAAGRERRAQLEAKRAQGTRPSLPLDAYAGVYADSLYGVATVSVEDGHLVASASPYLTGDLEHWHYNVFRVVWRNRWIGPGFVTFNIGPSGQVVSAEMDGATRKRSGSR